jgi:hypothetical protein
LNQKLSGKPGAVQVQAHPAVAQARKDALVAQFAQLDPVVLLHEIRQSQARLTAMADATSFFRK